MILIVLSGVLVLVLGGCVCVFLAARGGAPVWVRAAAKVTLAAGEVAGAILKSGGSNRRSGSDD